MFELVSQGSCDLTDEQRQHIFESLGSRKRMEVVGLSAAPQVYGFEPINYVRPSRYFLGTSSGRSYRRCKRKWGFQSSYRLGLEKTKTEENINFWFGSAIHFALEDWFGWNKFNDPRRAFKAYYEAHKSEELPNEAAVHYELGIGMLTYFLEWYESYNARQGFETAWFTHEKATNKWTVVPPHTEGSFPGCEVELTLDLGMRLLVDAVTGRILGILDTDDDMRGIRLNMAQSFMKYYDGILFDKTSANVETYAFFGQKMSLHDFDSIYEARLETGIYQVKVQPICFHGTVDRIVKDNIGRLWLVDYKTAKGADVAKLDTDDQVSRYMWAADQFLGMPVYGFVYLQLTKAIPKAPRILKDGKLSADKSQKTTYDLYRKAIIEIYGSVEEAPNTIINTLNVFAEKYTPEGDDFIRWDLVTRNDAQKEATYFQLIAEALEMIDGDRFLPATPTRDCIWDCPFRDACIALDSGNMEDFDLCVSDYATRKKERGEEGPRWMDRLKWPDVPFGGLATMEELNFETRKLNIIFEEDK